VALQLQVASQPAEQDQVVSEGGAKVFIAPKAAALQWCAMVAHALSYSNPGELRVRVTALARAAGWAL
jgi:hypothetical protein